MQQGPPRTTPSDTSVLSAMNSSGRATPGDASMEHAASSNGAGPLPRLRWLETEKSPGRTGSIDVAETIESPDGVDQGQVSRLPLTQKDLEEHNVQGGLSADWKSSLKLHGRRFEEFEEAARALGIDFPGHMLAAMWQGWHGLTPLEKFIAERDDLSPLLRETSRVIGEEGVIDGSELLQPTKSVVDASKRSTSSSTATSAKARSWWSEGRSEHGLVGMADGNSSVAHQSHHD